MRNVTDVHASSGASAHRGSFDIVADDRVYGLAATDAKQRDCWITALLTQIGAGAAGAPDGAAVPQSQGEDVSCSGFLWKKSKVRKDWRKRYVTLMK